MIDLHTHTCFSDGTLTPAALVDLAVERGLSALAITDHDTVEGLGEGAASAGTRLAFVPGIELSTALGDVEHHLLGYFVNPADPGLGKRLQLFSEQRLGRIQAMVDRLAAIGSPVSREEVLALAGPGVVGRPHLAAALVQAGHVGSIEEAFRRLIGRGGAAFVPRPSPSVEEGIALVRDAGGVAVLAHPGASTSDALVEQLVDAGLGGIEVMHPHHPPAIVRRYRALAERLDLIETGGSDFHGPGRSSDLGAMRVPERLLDSLQRAARR